MPSKFILLPADIESRGRMTTVMVVGCGKSRVPPAAMVVFGGGKSRGKGIGLDELT